VPAPGGARGTGAVVKGPPPPALGGKKAPPPRPPAVPRGPARHLLLSQPVGPASEVLLGGPLEGRGINALDSGLKPLQPDFRVGVVVGEHEGVVNSGEGLVERVLQQAR